MLSFFVKIRVGKLGYIEMPLPSDPTVWKQLMQSVSKSSKQEDIRRRKERILLHRKERRQKENTGLSL